VSAKISQYTLNSVAVSLHYRVQPAYALNSATATDQAMPDLGKGQEIMP